MGVWERRYYRVLNAFMRVLLRSPGHRLRSDRVLVLEFCGKRSGRRYRMPGFLRHNVHDANHYGVVLDDAGRPGEASLAALAESPDTKVITVSVGAGG